MILSPGKELTAKYMLQYLEQYGVYSTIFKKNSYVTFIPGLALRSILNNPKSFHRKGIISIT
jgi:hypothetical protein